MGFGLVACPRNEKHGAAAGLGGRVWQADAVNRLRSSWRCISTLYSPYRLTL